MDKGLVISAYASISQGKARLNGNIYFEEDAYTGFHDFSRAVYRKLSLQYPKFFKMDNPSKLALLTSELIWQKKDVPQHLDGSRIAVVLANRASSLDTDRIFGDSIRDASAWFPSPAVFVYTLPNIMIGEICIKKNITGENAFFIFDGFNATGIFEHVSEMMDQNRAEACLCGWCDVDDGKTDSFFMLVENGNLNKESLLFTVNNIEKTYKRT